MNIDLAALKAKMAAQKDAQSSTTVTTSIAVVPSADSAIPASVSPALAEKLAAIKAAQSAPKQQPTAPVTAETAKEIAAKLYEDVKGTSAVPSETFLQELDAQKLHDKIEALNNALLAEHPTMPSLLQEIHKTLIKQPDNVTILSDEEIGVVVSAAIRVQGVMIEAKAAPKTKKAATAKALEDLSSALDF